MDGWTWDSLSNGVDQIGGLITNVQEWNATIQAPVQPAASGTTVAKTAVVQPEPVVMFGMTAKQLEVAGVGLLLALFVVKVALK